MAIKKLTKKKVDLISLLTKIIFAIFSIYLLKELYTTIDYYTKNSAIDKSIEENKNKLASLQEQSNKTKRVLFDTGYYFDNIMAYKKIKNIPNLEITNSISKYKNMMEIKITYSGISPSQLKDMIISFSKLGYISDANMMGMNLHVVKFTREDALNALEGQPSVKEEGKPSIKMIGKPSIKSEKETK